MKGTEKEYIELLLLFLEQNLFYQTSWNFEP